jgi:hypothetical protein
MSKLDYIPQKDTIFFDFQETLDKVVTDNMASWRLPTLSNTE